MEKKTAFKVPDEHDRKSAIGPFTDTSNLVSKAITAITPLFKPIPKPGPSDWLTDHKEAGQSYTAYTKSGRNKVTATRKTIYIQPLEESIDEEFVLTLKKFTEAFYKGMDVVTRPHMNLKELGVDSRINTWTQKQQYNAGQILKVLESKVPSDAYCMIAVCMTDLYPRDAWNFVFGLASLQNRVGVFSFARYDENFFAESQENLQPTDKGTIMWSSCKVMVHEIGHMFGLSHCIHFHCLMSGSNHFDEAKNKPLFLCPVCLRKIQLTIGFNIAERYQGLSETCGQLGASFEDAAKKYGEFYKVVMQSYGANYQKYLDEDEAMRKKNSEANKQQPSQTSKPAVKSGVSTSLTKKPVAKSGQKVSLSGAKVSLDNQIDIYQNL